MLADRYTDEVLKNILLPKDVYHPFPTADERMVWDSLSPVLRQQLISRGELYLDAQWPPLPAVRFMDFKRNGNRSDFEKLHFYRRHALAALVLAECAEGQGRFIDQIVNGIWCICEESFWGVSAHNIVSKYPEAPLPDVTEPIIDLFAGETAGLLAWSYYLLKKQLDAVTPIISDRIYLEIKRRILDPYLERDDFWWMGFKHGHSVNNWNPWCNSNCLTAFLLIEDDEERRRLAVAKVMRSLDRFLDAYHDDGGCDEGTSYWGRAGASLFDCLELLYGVSEGKIDVYNEPLIQNIGRFIYRTHIADDYFINFADGNARVSIPAELVYRYGKRINDQNLMAIGANAYHLKRSRDSRRTADSLLRELPFIFDYNEIESVRLEPPYVRDVWLDGIQVMAARQNDGSYEGFYLAAKGGHNAESHNHNDIGQFIVYFDGKPIIIDVGVGTYTAQTFSSRRYDIWTMQSAYHNLPTVNGVQQQAGRNYKAKDIFYFADDTEARLSMDIAAAYPLSADIASWKRCCCLKREERSYVEIVDEFKLNKPSKDIMMTLMTCCIPTLIGEGIVELDDGHHKIIANFDSKKLEAIYERIDINDDRLRGVWGDHIFRIVLKAKNAVIQDIWTLRIYKA